MILALSLFFPALAVAQPAAPARDERTAPGQRAQMYEDIEILRRLLNSKLLSEYPPAKALAEAQNSAVPYRHWLLQGDAFNPQIFQLQNEPALSWGSFLRPYNASSQYPYYVPSSPYLLQNNSGTTWITATPARILDTEGTYLKGQGVVYTLTLPPPARNPKEQSSKPAPKAVSDWDRIRGELHNDKPIPDDAEVKGQPRKEPSLVQIILKVLAENGRHFAQLGDDEGLTVIITFRGDDPPPAKTAEPEKPQTSWRFGSGPSAEDKPKEATSQGPTSSAHDYELLAELHLKQGKYEEAVKALQQALDLKPGAKQTAGLYRKLAEAYLGLSKDAEARQAIDKAIEYLKAGQTEAPDPAKPPRTAHSPLPAKLIISAPRKLLDQVGSGKITVEEFQKAATVDYLTFPAAKE
jgi:tetratricopeptide (TPR) repeat protein